MSELPVTPRERVLTALLHRAPDATRPRGRVAFAWNFGPTDEMARVLAGYLAERGIDWPTLRDEVDDIRKVSPVYVGPQLPADTDIWGITRRSQSYGTGAYNEIAHYPLSGVTDPAVLDDYPWPDPHAYDFSGFREQVLAEVGASDGCPQYRASKLGIDTCGNPFEIYCWMTGLEESLVNVLLNPDLVRAALSKITHYFSVKMTETFSEASDLVDILYFADDLGGQRSLLMSKRAYREVLKPFHAQLFSLGKRLAPHAATMLHTDGAVFDILPDLLDAGLEVLEAVQVDAARMEPERLKAAYGDRLCFHGGIAVQSLLPNDDADTVYAECRRLVEVFGEGGGYIAAPTHAVQVGTPPENVLAMLRAVLGEEEYETALGIARM